MGYSYSEEAGPKMCFNAAKLWQLGWNSNRHLSLSSSEPFYKGDLAGIIDNPDSPGSPMIIKINDPSGKDYFINFNVRAGFNSGSKEGGDEVLVVRAGDGIGYAESQLKAKLGAGSSYKISNFDGGKELSVQVNSINTQTRIANISVCVGECPPDCTSNAACDDSDDCTMDVCIEGVCSNSPLESEQCSVCPGERVLDILVVTDRYPSETSWTLQNKCTGDLQEVGRGFIESETEYGTGQICVPKGDYEFTINDAYGDGICCGWGDGSFSITYNGTPVSLGQSDFSFQFSKSLKFGEDCPQNNEFDLANPTSSPSRSPTKLPSRAPTPSPSRSPSAQPTRSPTKLPSRAPTTSPSRSPTKLPSRAPSSIPSTSTSVSRDPLPWCGDIDRSGTNFCKGVADDISQCSQARGDDPSEKISSLCPITCGAECKCYDLESFEHQGKVKDCDWAKRRKKCTKSKFMAYCPKKCGVCK